MRGCDILIFSEVKEVKEVKIYNAINCIYTGRNSQISHDRKSYIELPKKSLDDLINPTSRFLVQKREGGVLYINQDD